MEVLAVGCVQDYGGSASEIDAHLGHGAGDFLDRLHGVVDLDALQRRGSRVGQRPGPRDAGEGGGAICVPVVGESEMQFAHRNVKAHLQP
jgi:hypothetical protein